MWATALRQLETHASRCFKTLANVLVHEPLSLTLSRARRWVSYAKNAVPRLNRALPAALRPAEADRAPRGLPPLADFEVHSRRVARLLARNPGSSEPCFTLHGTNCYIVGTGPKRVLIDAGEGKPAFADALRDALRTLNCTVDRCIITHRHMDHVGGVPQLRELLPGVEVRKMVEKRFKPADADEGYDGTLVDGERIKVDEETTLRVWHTPGHCEDHCSFILEEERAIFAGDNVLGLGSSWFEDLPRYMRTLSDMLRCAEDERLLMLFPGHGPPAEDAAKRLREYVDHRAKREGQVRDALPPEAPGRTSYQIVKSIYPTLSWALFPAAQSNVLAHLGKLEKDGVARNLRYDVWARAPPLP